MAFRVKIVTPIQVDERDLERRRRRYGERAGAGTEIQVVGITTGPHALESAEDLAASDEAVFAEAARTAPEECDAVLIDCIFDPAVDRLEAVLPVPVFGPMRTALGVLPMIAPSFGIVARATAHRALFTALIDRYGARDRLVSVRTMDLLYAEGRDPQRFDAAMREQLAAIVEQDGARAVLMGSTTMALEPAVAAVAGGVPLLLSGMMTLGIMESLWRDGLLSAPRPG